MNPSVHVSDNLVCNVSKIQTVDVLPNGFRSYTDCFKRLVKKEYYNLALKCNLKRDFIINLLVCYFNINKISNKHNKPFNYYSVYHLLHS